MPKHCYRKTYNPPQWLKEAKTQNEDVESISLGLGYLAWRRLPWRRLPWRRLLGGNFLGGNFLGGNFRGGNFLGGNFRGVPSNFAMSIGHAEDYTKVLVGSISGIAYIYAGCRWFTLKEAKDHWFGKQEERPLTCALLLTAIEIAKIKGLRESEE